MRKISMYIRKAVSMPFPALCRRAYEILSHRAISLLRRVPDMFFDTHLSFNFDCSKINWFVDVNDLDISGIDKDTAHELLKMWQEHRFDLLGSGWVRCGFYDNAPGILGYRYPGLVLDIDKDCFWIKKLLNTRNQRRAVEIYRKIPYGYQPIDWQKDFKSGYRWSEKVWYFYQRLADKPGGDIKAPWELSRLQHLPRMAIFSCLFPDEADNIKNEFCYQCLDFIALNPPRMGVNWKCTMDVGIRLANMALAYSLFHTGGRSFSEGFNQVFFNSIYEHCNHIVKNLEWSEVLTSNHYLENVCGLLFGSALLPESIKRREWLDFAIRELKREVVKQFHDEGTNFEGSTAYHRLSSDMMIHSVALISAFEGKPTDYEIAKRISGSTRFMEAITRPDGSFTQVGDNDSGYFFRLSPTGSFERIEAVVERYKSLSGYKAEQSKENCIDENMNDCRMVLSAASGLLDTSEFEQVANTYPLENSLVKVLCKGFLSEYIIEKPTSVLHQANTDLPYSKELHISGVHLKSGLRRSDYPEFGIYVFRSDNMYLLVNASDNGQNGNAGHAHNDKLSFELIINGEPYF